MNINNQLNFSAGPGVLPDVVLQQVQQAILEVPEVGLSILGISHRTDWFTALVTELEDNIRSLLGLSKNYHVLFLQGGATQQFSMVPMSLLRGKNKSADYLNTGYWSRKILTEARREGKVNVLWDGADSNFIRLPSDEELNFSENAAYLHYISNETVEGLQFHRVLGLDNVTRICDMSSDFLSKPCQAERFSLIYAHAQKNLGPAGVTIVLICDELLAEMSEDVPSFLNYRYQIDSHSNLNTPPVFAIYVVWLVTRWLMHDIGGVAAMDKINQRKAGLLYDLLDNSEGFYHGRVAKSDRSLMNVAFNLPNEKLAQQFITEAEHAHFSGLAGHRAVGGLRASIYNALTVSAVEQLVDFMTDFRLRNG